MTDKRPKPLQVPTEDESPITSSGLMAATIGASIKRVLKDSSVGYILIVLDDEGASLATSEDTEEAINVLTHFATDKKLFQNGFVVMECPCSHCEAYRRGEVH